MKIDVGVQVSRGGRPPASTATRATLNALGTICSDGTALSTCMDTVLQIALVGLSSQ